MSKQIVKYGRCKNPECINYGSPIEITEDGLCLECHRPIEPDEDDDVNIEESTGLTSQKKQMILACVIVVAIIGIAVAIFFMVRTHNAKVIELAEIEKLEAITQAKEDSIATQNKMLEQVRRDSINQAEIAARLEAEAAEAAEQARLAEEAANASQQQKSATPNTLSGSVDYGKWSGSWKNGKPNGNGTMKYTKEHLIDSRDPQKRVANKGDYIIGEFADGKLIQGVWYDSSNNVKGSIIIGM